MLWRDWNLVTNIFYFHLLSLILMNSEVTLSMIISVFKNILWRTWVA